MSKPCGDWCPFLACQRCDWQGWVCQSCGKPCDQGEPVCETCGQCHADDGRK